MIFLRRPTIKQNKLPLLIERNFIMYEKGVISYLMHRVKADMAVNVLDIMLTTEIAWK
jgi:hypothetical protein